MLPVIAAVASQSKGKQSIQGLSKFKATMDAMQVETVGSINARSRTKVLLLNYKKIIATA